MTTRLLRVDEVAHRLGLRPATIRKMIFKRQLPVVRPTKRAVRVREDDVDALCRVTQIASSGAGSHQLASEGAAVKSPTPKKGART